MSQVASLPRVIDYWLGGPQHTPADVAEGDRLAELHPDVPHLFRAQRAFQRHVLDTMADAGLSQFLIFKAGLPTAGHAHEQLPEARIYYTDDNFDVVQPGAGLLAGVRRRVRYQTLDATELENLEDLEFSPVLKTDQPIGVFLSGACEVWDDETLKVVVNNLHAWAKPGSMLAFTHATHEAGGLSPWFQASGGAFNLRSRLEIEKLLGEWWVGEDGVTPLAQILDEGAPAWMVGIVAKHG